MSDLRQGLTLRSLAGTIALAPPLVLSRRAQADEMVRILRGAIERAVAEVEAGS